MQQEKEVVVILGDWFIDENWLVAPRRTHSSSYSDGSHYLTKHSTIDRRMISLCGASEILEILRNYFINRKEIEFIGYGAWNINDNEILQCTLCPKHVEHKHLTPFTITSLQKPTSREHNRECPYDHDNCDFNPNLINLSHTDCQLSSNRIVRCYEGYGGGKPRLIYRIDWELPVSKLDYENFNQLQGRNTNIVILEDHGKGVISEESISALIERLKPNLKRVKWYIRSKLDNPKWLDLLKKNNCNVRLKVIDYKLAYYKKGKRRFTYGPKLGRASLELLGELTGATVYRHGKPEGKIFPVCERTAVLFDNNTVIAKDHEKTYNLYRPVINRNIINIGMTTIFFNALIAQDLDDQFKSLHFGSQCHNALKMACEWSNETSLAWSNEEPHFYGNYANALDNLKTCNLDPFEISPVEYNQLWKEWNSSSYDKGLIEVEGKNVFQLWRGTGAIKDYICVGGPKRSAINNLLSSINEFISEKNNKHPFNAFLLASPGWGKSYLTKCIAEHFEMQYLSFSLSQMATTKDLIDCFDIICSAQNTSNKKTLIFLDEINCEIQGNHAMGLLLSPIWDGSFIRDGKRFALRPSVWIFASTGVITEFSNENKGSDFISRLNGPIIELDTLVIDTGEPLRVPLKKFKQQWIEDPEKTPEQNALFKQIKSIRGPFQTEQVYIGVSLLNNLWGPISKIQIELLDLLQNIVLINGFRSMEFFISKFTNIERGTVYPSNVPVLEKNTELKRHIILPKIWREMDKSPSNSAGQLINIETMVKL